MTDISYATVTAQGPNVVVYVDGNGNPVSTTTLGVAGATPAPEAAPVVVSVPAPAPAAPAPASPAPASDDDNTASPTPESAPSNSHSHSEGSASVDKASAIAYSPYNSDGTCKSQDQVNTDVGDLASKGYGLIRIYGTDCGQVSTVGSVAKAKGLKLFAGIFDISNVAGDAQTIISAAGGDWSHFHTISVGNELVNTGAASPEQVIAALNQARGILNAAGYTGNIVTVDTFNAIIANPSLCQASDYAAANAHAFFDPAILADAAGTWVKATASAVKIACGGKDVLITETGMPSSGTCNGLMCPSAANQVAAISSIRSAMPAGSYILFSAYNDLWKTNAEWNHYAEQSYGIYGNAPSS